MTRNQHHIGAVNAATGNEVVKAFTIGRVCAAPECGTILSRYNPAKTCATHSGYKAAMVAAKTAVEAMVIETKHCHHHQ